MSRSTAITARHAIGSDVATSERGERSGVFRRAWRPQSPRITPAEVLAARLAREAARHAKTEAAQMRLVVLGIWAVALTLALGLAIVVIPS
jgi:hypothetical protein